MILNKKLSIALIQLKQHISKHDNFSKVESLVSKALKTKPNLDLIVLPETFTFPYSIRLFREYAEHIPHGETSKFLSQLARLKNVSIVGGSISEKTEDNSDKFNYNTSTVFNAQGELIAKHRKVHLFDVDIPNGISFQESGFLKAGNKSTVFELPDFGKVGLAICYDLRFPRLASMAAKDGAFLMCYPSAFNTHTGPLHWELLARSRALDNQMYVALCSPALDTGAKYHCYGHSMVVDPMGKVIAQAGQDEEIIYADLDPAVLERARESIPISKQQRPDVYSGKSSAL